MDSQTHVPGSQKTHLCRSVFPPIYYSSGRDTHRPTQQPSPTTPSAVAQRLVSQHLAHHHTSGLGEKTPSQEEEVPSTRDCKSTHRHDLVQMFRDWFAGEGEFRLAEVRQRGLTIQIPIQDFRPFRRALNMDDDEKLVVCSFIRNLPNSSRFPKYSYNSLLSTLKIQSRPSALHEQAISTISQGFVLAIHKVSPELRRRISIVTNEQLNGFVSQYKGSHKIPDMALKTWDTAGRYKTKFVLEVGLTETYEMLLEDMKMWLEGRNDVSAVMLVKLQEDPDYHCPTRNLSDQDYAHQSFHEAGEIGGDDFTLVTSYGPALYKGYVWVGRVSGFFEIWKREPVSGSAICTSNRIVS